MLAQVYWEDTVGKKVVNFGVYDDTYFFVVFEDGYAVVQIAGYEGTFIEIDEGPDLVSVIKYTYNHKALLSLGLVTEDDLKDAVAAAARRDAEERTRLEQQERETYARLKAKFETPTK